MDIKEILRQHQLWLNGEGGKRANLQRADLQEADLQWADLRRADLRRADLRRADLQWADLQEADLRWANLDFSCWPLWCGSHSVKVDKRIAVQLAAHFCALDCDNKEYQEARRSILKFAKQFHRISEFPL